MFGDKTELQLVPKWLLQVSVTELHNSLVSYHNDGGLKDAMDEDDNIIISNYTLCSLLPPQLKQISATCSSPIFPLRSHSLVCSKDNLFILGIGPICDKEL